MLWPLSFCLPSSHKNTSSLSHTHAHTNIHTLSLSHTHTHSLIHTHTRFIHVLRKKSVHFLSSQFSRQKKGDNKKQANARECPENGFINDSLLIVQDLKINTTRSTCVIKRKSMNRKGRKFKNSSHFMRILCRIKVWQITTWNRRFLFQVFLRFI